MLFPRMGENVNNVSQCYRILGTIKNVIVHSNKNQLEFTLNATPSLSQPDWLGYNVILEEVPGINDGMNRGGDMVARIVGNTDGCKSEYYDFYFFGTWNEVPQIVWADSYMTMSALRWKHSKMLMKK